ncbi:MAG: ABC-three component system protein, partial [Alphaproteobacteria bacterium]
ILDIARNINSARVNVCVVNSAHDIVALNEDVDRWRDYSGMYIAKGRKAYSEQFPAVRRFSSEQIDGAVIRTTTPSVLGGPLRWTFDNATGRHLWAVQKDYGVTAPGTLIESPCADRFRFETLRVLKRVVEAHDAPAPHRTVPARASYRTVETQVNAEAPPAAEIICQKLLFGEAGREADERLTADTLSRFIDEVSAGMKALGAIKSQQNTNWQVEPEQKGQLHLQADMVNVLVWCYPGLSIRMQQTIQRWRSELGAVTPLLIFRKATGTHYPTPHGASQRRRDIAEPPPAGRRVADESASIPHIVECDLDEIENCFGTEDPATFAAEIHARIVAGMEKFSGAGG